MTHFIRAEALSMVAVLRHDVRALTLRGPLDRTYSVPLTPAWTALPGRAGVRFFHVPHPDDTGSPPALYSAQFEVAAGACYTAGVILQSRLIAICRGRLSCNGRVYGPGDSFWLASEESTTWLSVDGCSGSVFYNQPNPAAAPYSVLYAR